MFFGVNFHGVVKLAIIQTRLWQEDWTKFGYKLNMKVIFFKAPYFLMFWATLYLNHVKKSSGFFFLFLN